MEFPQTGFLRLSQICGDPKNGINGIIPVSRATWWRGCRTGTFPAPIKLSQGVTVWRAEDIRALIASVGGGTAGSEKPRTAQKRREGGSAVSHANVRSADRKGGRE